MIRYNKEIINSIIKEIVENKNVTQKELALKYLYSERTIRRYMKFLKERNIIVLRKCGNKRYWELK